MDALRVASCVYLLWAVFGVLEPLYVRDVLGGSDAMFALLQTVFGDRPRRSPAWCWPSWVTASRGRATSRSR